MQRLMLVVPLSILMIFVLLFDAFKSFRDALIIICNIPFALIGGIFALLLTNLMSVGFVDTVAYLKLAQKFNETLMQDAFARFREDVTAYLKTYGDWPTAKVSEPFELFVMRHELQLGRPLRHVAPGGFPPGDEPPPPGDRPEPAYRFILFDDRHRALLPTPPYREGDEVRPLDVERDAGSAPPT